MQTEKAYKKLKKRKTKTVIVAVIDSGVDIEHKDLEGKIWTNLKEVPGNGLDDDIFLFIEEQTDRRFVYKVGYERKLVGEGERFEHNDKGEVIREYYQEDYDLIYTLIFNPKIKAIDPKDFINREEIFYINFDNDIFYFNGLPLSLTKTANYYKAFCILYSLIPDGGEALFSDLIKKTRESLRPYKTKDEPEIIKFLQDNLTGKKNGFQRKAGIPDLLDNGKSILVNIRGRGIQFNNEK